MQSKSARRKLLRTMHDGPVPSYVVLVKCAAGLSVVALIAAIGAGDRVDPRGAADAAAIRPLPIPPVQEHRKQVFDERRQDFHGARKRSSVAGGTQMPENLSPVMLR